MKSKFKIFLIYFLLFTIFSCSTELNSKVENTFLRLRTDKNKFKAIFIIPSNGCSGCISDSENFILKYLTKRDYNLLVILTSYRNEKEIKMKLGERILYDKRIFHDKQNVFFQEGISLIYPIIYYPYNGNVSFVSHQEPDALKKLQKYLQIKN